MACQAEASANAGGKCWQRSTPLILIFREVYLIGPLE